MLNNEALKTFLSESDYIILNDKKQPLKAFKDGQNVHKLNEVISESNLGLLLKGQWVVIDVDCKDHPEAAKKMIDIIDRYGWQCNIMKTTRGIHLWFQAPSIKDIKNMVEVITPVGIMVDVKCAERNSYVVIKKDGVMRQWLQFFDLVDYLPLELTPISNKAFKEIDSPINLQKGET
ncbi:bifunctional DNA primase/polymerase [Mycoplasmopsis felis]|uniref:bifunctional DNA primase/polymerase n=1 Tax=Mycoplasmopsis felis TaxID=33923 RepID=UPI0021DF5CF5|nr:bifunctional DNA primase/polymerase [Mycoplasmopsis felis]MCU9939249.1 bifunctional DNA primase/polymerase [Mycoplasmopsis felis]